MEKKNNAFENKVKPILLYVGTIGAIIMSIAYVILMFVMVLGFKIDTTLTQAIVFAIVNAIVGFIIMQMLKIQGIDFAKQIEENQNVLKEWNTKTIKKKKTHSMSFFWFKTISFDIIIKFVTTVIMTSTIIYIVVEGSNDYNMLLMALVNLLMFICFGFLSLVKAYDYFNEKYIPYLVEKTNERKNEKNVDMVKEELNKQTDDNLHVNRGNDILVTSSSDEHNSNNNGPVVVDSDSRDNIVLVGAVHPGICFTDSTNICDKKNASKNNQKKESEN